MVPGIYHREVSVGYKRRDVKDAWAKLVREAARTQSVMTFIVIRQATLAQWVALLPIFEVCAV